MEIPKSFLGYKRENGRAGTRNHVIILPVDDISNACAEAVANNIKGTIALPHSYGRLQFGADLELHFRTMIGTGKNPNVAAVIVIGIEPKWTKRIVDAIAKTGKPVEGFSIEGVGDIDTIAKVSKKAQEFSMWASEKQREECPMSDLWISVKCGESDTTSGLASNPTVGNLMEKLEPFGVHLCFGETSELTGAETVCAKRGKTPEAQEKFMKTWNEYNDFILKEATNDLSESQPTAGNIAGGLTTIEEKAFGNFQKIGNLKFIDVFVFSIISTLDILILFCPTNDVTSPKIPGLSGNETHNDVLYLLSICLVFSRYCQYFLIAERALPVLVDESQRSDGETFFEVVIFITSPFLNSLCKGLSFPLISHPIAVSPI